MLADVTREYRRQLGLTQEDLAERTGLSARSISKIEAGRTAVPRLTTLRLLADAFGLVNAERERFLQTAAGAVAVPTPGTGTPGPPQQLPAPPQTFVGRTGELAELIRLCDSSTVSIAAIDGMAGTGKPVPGKVTQIAI